MKTIGKLLFWGLAAFAAANAVLVARVTLLPPSTAFDGYNYSSYRQIEADSTRSSGPAVGELFPADVEIFDRNGEAIRLRSLWADQPLVLEFGSVSCPIFHGNGPSMEELFAKYDKGSAEKARIGMLYVREAHPGWLQRPHRDVGDKLANAKRLSAKGVVRPIWVDGVDGGLHKILNPMPNAVYVINTDGRVVYKSVWNVPAQVDQVLDMLTTRNELPTPSLSNSCGDPSRYYSQRDMLAYIGRIAVVGGPDALADFVVNEMFEPEEAAASAACEIRL
jgi:hypothetical protein